MRTLITTLIAVAAIAMPRHTVAQTYERSIRWTEDRQYTTPDGRKVTIPCFDGASVSGQDGYLPHYGERIAMAQDGRVTVTLSDEVYESIKGPAITSKNISSSVIVHAVVSAFRRRPYAMISFCPLRHNPNTGQVEKLISYRLHLDILPDRQTKKMQAYTASSVLATGSWYRVGVTATGIYKLDYNFLKNNCQLDVDHAAFSTIAVFGYGGGMVPDLNAAARPDDLPENATYISDQNGNNKMDPGDYILLYAQGPDRWSYDTAFHHFIFEKNLYSDTSFFFITTDRGTGKRVSSVASAPSPGVTISQFDDYAVRQVDKYNTLHSGKIWLGDRMSTLSPEVSIPFHFPNLVTSAPVYFASYAAATSPYASVITATVNGSQVLSHSISAINYTTDDYPDAFHTNDTGDIGEFGNDVRKAGSFTATSSDFNIVYRFSNPDGNGTSAGYIYQLVVNATRSLTAEGAAMFFRSVASVGPGRVSRFHITGLTSGTHIWDVTDLTDIHDISAAAVGSSDYDVATDRLREFAAVQVNGTFPTPVPIGRVSSQNLHAMGQPSMLLISPDALLSAANDLAAFHSQQDHLSCKVVPLQQVYNEFSSGRQDISAIRDLVRMLYERAGSDSAQMPQYLLLMGDGSFDPKGRIADNNNLVPTYQSINSKKILTSYTSDDFFGCLDPQEGSDMNNTELVDIAIGRIPAADAQEAQGIVDKIKLYKSPAALGSWRNLVTMVSDEPWGQEYSFQTTANRLGEYVRLNYPDYNVDKIFCDAYPLLSTPGGGRYPDVNTAIVNHINTGTLVMGYTGHGGVNNWANARIFNQSDIQNLRNKEKLPLFVTATCDFSRFDDPAVKTAGEFLMTNARGGACAMVTTVRPVYEYQNERLQDELFPLLFSYYHGRRPTIGEVMMETKNALLTDFSLVPNTREFTLLGDPAMTLDYPGYEVITTAVDNVPVSQPHDTLKALKYITINGEVRDHNGARMTSFNGICYPSVYDKLTTFTTLVNAPKNYIPYTFPTYKNPLFRGQCRVVNGQFSFSFIVPKDINYAIGNGRISYYADNGSTDANGYRNDIVVGGALDTLYGDKIGPKIKLYMNDTKFVYGGITDPNPTLLAELWDTSGINTSGNGLGHDLTAILDANTRDQIILNDHYQSSLDNFRSGKISYPFSSLADGQHTLKVKAWDILNNSSEDNTEFIVAPSAKLALKHVYNYPNPFTTRTQFMFEHNRPGEQLKIQVQIYSVSGRLIKTIIQDEVATGYRVDDLRWDGLDDYGDKIGKGVYVYKIHVRDQEGNTADQFQKLVVLR